MILIPDRFPVPETDLTKAQIVERLEHAKTRLWDGLSDTLGTSGWLCDAVVRPPGGPVDDLGRFIGVHIISPRLKIGNRSFGFYSAWLVSMNLADDFDNPTIQAGRLAWLNDLIQEFSA